MKLRTLATASLLGSLLLGPVGPAAAQSDDGEHRKVEALQKISAANELTIRHGAYTRARDKFLSGDDSLYDQTVAWQEDSLAWLEEWIRMLAIADLQGDMSFGQFQSALRQSLRDQAKRVNELSYRAAALSEAAIEVVALIHSGDAPSGEVLAPYQEAVDSMVRRENELRQAANTMAQTMNARLEEMLAIEADVKRGILGRLQVALVEQSAVPVTQALHEIESLLDAQSVVDPVLAELRRTELDMRRASVHYRAFQIKDGLEPARASCEAASSLLDSVVGAEGYVNASRTEAERVCAQIEQHGSLVESYPAWMFTQYMMSIEKGSLLDVCKGEKVALGCEKLAVLAGLPDAEYANMTEDELRFVEKNWVRLLDEAVKHKQ